MEQCKQGTEWTKRSGGERGDEVSDCRPCEALGFCSDLTTGKT